MARSLQNCIIMLHSVITRAVLFAALMLAFTGLHAQKDAKAKEVSDQVIGALGQGNASTVAKYMVAQVDMTLPAASDYYSKAQAEQILRKFFDEHQPKGMAVAHEGTNRSGDCYYIGDLSTEKGDFRVTFFLKKGGEGYQVKQLRVETGR